VVGRAFLIIWPPSRWRVLDIPSTFQQPGIERSSSLGQPGSPGEVPADAAAIAVVPSAPYLPLTGGVVGAIPLTLLQRRLRRRWRWRWRRSGR
jgi:signal peptidase I